jgi:hypothetical protein
MIRNDAFAELVQDRARVYHVGEVRQSDPTPN